jgi:hypothetical protein
MEITDEMIIDCAIQNGFKPISDCPTVCRAVTMWGKDLGEWWISEPKRISVRVVRDDDMKSYMRDLKINSLGI